MYVLGLSATPYPISVTHGPENCGMYCQLRYEIRPYGHHAPTDVEFYQGMHGPENCGEKCVTQSDGESDICAISNIGDICEKPFSGVSGVPGVPDVCDICAICDIGDICEKAVSGVSRVPGVPDVPHGTENCRTKCVTRRNDGGPGDRDSNSCHSDMCMSPPGHGGFGDSQFAYMDAPGWTMPELETDRSRRRRTWQVTMIEGREALFELSSDPEMY